MDPHNPDDDKEDQMTTHNPKALQSQTATLRKAREG
jgi:hypothetical protein